MYCNYLNFTHIYTILDQKYLFKYYSQIFIKTYLLKTIILFKLVVQESETKKELNVPRHNVLNYAASFFVQF